MDVSPRLTRWINKTFAHGSAEPVLTTLRELPAEVVGGQNPERVQASLVVRTGGKWDAFQDNVALAKADWRDSLVRADLADDDWPHRLDAILGAD